MLGEPLNIILTFSAKQQLWNRTKLIMTVQCCVEIYLDKFDNFSKCQNQFFLYWRLKRQFRYKNESLNQNIGYNNWYLTISTTKGIKKRHQNQFVSKKCHIWHFFVYNQTSTACCVMNSSCKYQKCLNCHTMLVFYSLEPYWTDVGLFWCCYMWK